MAQESADPIRGLSKKHSEWILTNLNHAYFTTTPKAFRNIFGLKTDAVAYGDETVRLGTRKINTIENVAQTCLMIKNRLTYGTGFRADLITLTHIENTSKKGTELARLICADNSTVSPILNDLKASCFLNQDGEREGSFEPYSGMFVSVVSVWNLCEMMDATEFSLKELKEGVLDSLNFKHDVFGRKVLKKLL